jgi:hypothetical protein
MKLDIMIKEGDAIVVQLRAGKKVVDEENLTLSQGFDILLITAIDKLLLKNRIDRLSLKSLEISGKTRPGAVSNMVMRAIKAAVGS